MHDKLNTISACGWFHYTDKCPANKYIKLAQFNLDCVGPLQSGSHMLVLNQLYSEPQCSFYTQIVKSLQ
jgi:hypothetical protein